MVPSHKSSVLIDFCVSARSFIFPAGAYFSRMLYLFNSWNGRSSAGLSFPMKKEQSKINRSRAWRSGR